MVGLLVLAACSGPGPLPPTATSAPSTPTPRPTVTSVPTSTATPRPTPPPTPLPGTKAAPVGTQNIPLPTAVPGTPPPMMGTPKAAASATPAMPLGPAYRIAFVSGRDGSDDIFTADPSGYRLTNLTHAQKKSGKDSDPQWSPDGTQIAFVSDRDGNADIWVMNMDGSGAKNLTRANMDDDLAPRWSPDSKRIAYVSFRNNDADVYIMNRDGGDPQDVTKSDSDDLQPAWSPDSSQLVFVSARNNKPRAVYTVKIADPGNATAIVSPPCDAANPVWSPDSKTIAVAACAGADGKSPTNTDIGAVFTVPAGGGSLTAVTDGKADSGTPVWSPDSSMIAFWSYRNAQQADVVLLTVGNGARQTIMAPPGAARDIAWSPDGANLAFVSGDFNAGQVVIAGTTGNPHPLLPNAANDHQPSWSPMPIP